MADSTIYIEALKRATAKLKIKLTRQEAAAQDTREQLAALEQTELRFQHLVPKKP